MNKLPLHTRAQILSLLVEGNSMRATSRITNTSLITVTKLLRDAGNACTQYHNEKVRNLNTKRIQADECWSYVYAKAKNVPEEKKESGAGDCWTWVAMDADSKIVISWYVGSRDTGSATEIMQDVAGRLKSRVQLTTDGLKAYLEGVANAFGSQIDYAQLIKVYGTDEQKEKRYSPAECIGIQKHRVSGCPEAEHVSTSFIERQNLTMRMHMRRFTRLTNAFSKKIENHCHAIALHFFYYNFCRIHKTLRVTPAMESGLTDNILTMETIVELIDKNEN